MRILLFFLTLAIYLSIFQAKASSILIPMDENQQNHLKSYGIAYWALTKQVEVSWLLNYRGGSFMTNYHQFIENECRVRGVSYQVISDAQALNIESEIGNPEANMDRSLEDLV